MNMTLQTTNPRTKISKSIRGNLETPLCECHYHTTSYIVWTRILMQFSIALHSPSPGHKIHFSGHLRCRAYPITDMKCCAYKVSDNRHGQHQSLGLGFKHKTCHVTCHVTAAWEAPWAWPGFSRGICHPFMWYCFTRKTTRPSTTDILRPPLSDIQGTEDRAPSMLPA